MTFSMASLFTCWLSPKANPKPFLWVGVSEASSVYMSMFGTAATLLGFVIAASTFLAAHVRAPEFVILRQSAAFSQLFGIFESSMWRLMALMIASAIASRSSKDLLWEAGSAVLALSVYASISLAVLVWTTMRILKVRPSS